MEDFCPNCECPSCEDYFNRLVIFTLGTIDEMIEAGLITATPYSTTVKGLALFDQIKASGFRPPKHHMYNVIASTLEEGEELSPEHMMWLLALIEKYIDGEISDQADAKRKNPTPDETVAEAAELIKAGLVSPMEILNQISNSIEKAVIIDALINEIADFVKEKGFSREGFFFADQPHPIYLWVQETEPNVAPTSSFVETATGLAIAHNEVDVSITLSRLYHLPSILEIRSKINVELLFPLSCFKPATTSDPVQISQQQLFLWEIDLS
jgi:hypothetical protein